MKIEQVRKFIAGAKANWQFNLCPEGEPKRGQYNQLQYPAITLKLRDEKGRLIKFRTFSLR